MDEADRLSTTALSVALVALIVSITQLLQQIFGTAEGYRKCRREVIGPWAAFTRRKFVWYELRMETRFVTPELSLLSPAQVRAAYSSSRGPFPLIATSAADATPEMYDTLHGDKSELARSQRHRADELLVSWIPFLQALHTMEASPITKPKGVEREQRSCNCERPTFRRHNHRERIFARARRVSSTPTEQADSSLSSKGPEAVSSNSAVDEPEVTSRHGSVRTDLVVLYREWSWDFMPAEVVRPLATTHLGALIVMTSRLGMEWQVLDIGKPELRASGNGYYLASTQIRGLGIAVHFSTSPETTNRRNLIPSEYCDMLTFGILPGDPRLLGEEVSFPLIGDDRKVSLLRNIFDYLRLSNNAINELNDSNFRNRRLAWWEGNFRRSAINDVIVLLCPFLPIESSQCDSIAFLGWVGTTPCTVWNYWEAKVILYDELEKRTANADLPQDSKLMVVRAAFRYLEENWPGRFYKRRLHGRHMARKSPEHRTETCRKYFELTTDYFDNLQHTQNEKHVPILYQDLVASHSEMALLAGLQARRDTKSAKDPPSSYFARYKKWPNPNPKVKPVPDGFPGAFPAKSMADVAWMYVKFQDKFRAELRRRVEERSGHCTASDEELEEAWWMLMLRGLCWMMAISWTAPNEAIPSSYYQNRTPIWIG